MYGTQSIVQVSGENGARAYQMMPNSSVILLDNSAPLIWVCVTDGAGYKTVTPYKIEQYVPPEPVDMQDVLARLERLENESYNRSTKNYRTESIDAES